MLKTLRLILLLSLIIAASISIATGAQAANSRIDVLKIDGVINPVVANYIDRGITQAGEDNAVACIIQMDTPGGLDTSMRDMVQDIVNSQVPVIVYVSPSGARAASAGVFITMAAHIAAMSPNTAIGAAHPVAIGTEGEAQMSEEMEEKVVNDAAAPNIATILLSLAILGITIEIYSPGLIFPGVFGGVSLFLALYSLGILPINYAGLALIGLAGGLFIAEIYTASFGIFITGGIASLVIGSLILFSGRPELFQPEPWLVPTIAAVIGSIAAFIIYRVVRIHRQQAKTGREELPGKTAIVKRVLEPEGTVLYKGELWTALLDKGQAKLGEEVTITKSEGLKLYVTKKQQNIK